MASTQLKDLIIVPEVFSENVILRTLNTNRFLASGVAARDAEMDAFLNSNIGGSVYSPRYFGALDDTDPNISSDDPTEKSTPNKITGLKNSAVRQSLNSSWSSMDLSADLAGADPIGAITSQIGDYWNTVSNKRMLASLVGVIAGNVANNDSDMVVDVTAETGAASLWNPDAFIDAKATMGDISENLSAIAVHSRVQATMQKLNLIEFIVPSEGGKPVATYGGLPIIVDDAMTIEKVGTSGSEKYHYYTYLFGRGAVALGMGAAKVPYELEREPASGNGGGQENIYSRVEMIIHPQGWKCNLTETPTLAELKLAASWTRAFERKRCPLACLKTLG